MFKENLVGSQFVMNSYDERPRNITIAKSDSGRFSCATILGVDEKNNKNLIKLRNDFEGNGSDGSGFLFGIPIWISLMVGIATLYIADFKMAVILFVVAAIFSFVVLILVFPELKESIRAIRVKAEIFYAPSPAVKILEKSAYSTDADIRMARDELRNACLVWSENFNEGPSTRKITERMVAQKIDTLKRLLADDAILKKEQHSLDVSYRDQNDYEKMRDQSTAEALSEAYGIELDDDDR